MGLTRLYSVWTRRRNSFPASRRPHPPWRGLKWRAISHLSVITRHRPHFRSSRSYSADLGRRYRHGLRSNRRRSWSGARSRYRTRTAISNSRSCAWARRHERGWAAYLSRVPYPYRPVGPAAKRR